MSACSWCGKAKPSRAEYCSKRCRQTAWRLRKRRDSSVSGPAVEGLTLAYADPPYPGQAGLYRDQATFGGEVDHAGLIAFMCAAFPAGWALSTSSKALRQVLPWCPEGVRVCSWVKPIGVSSSSLGLTSRWEPLLVYGGRQRAPGVRDWLSAQPDRCDDGHTLIGRKPVAFSAWLFDALGMLPGDTLVDLYPGTGRIAGAWRDVSRAAGVPVEVVDVGPLGLGSSLAPHAVAARVETPKCVVCWSPVSGEHDANLPVCGGCAVKISTLPETGRATGNTPPATVTQEG